MRQSSETHFSVWMEESVRPIEGFKALITFGMVECMLLLVQFDVFWLNRLLLLPVLVVVCRFINLFGGAAQCVNCVLSFKRINIDCCSYVIVCCTLHELLFVKWTLFSAQLVLGELIIFFLSAHLLTWPQKPKSDCISWAPKCLYLLTQIFTSERLNAEWFSNFTTVLTIADIFRR